MGLLLRTSRHWQYVHVYADANIRKRKDRDGRDNDVLLTDAAKQELMVRLPRALEAYYMDYRDLESVGVRSVGSDAAAAAEEGGSRQESDEANGAESAPYGSAQERAANAGDGNKS